MCKNKNWFQALDKERRCNIICYLHIVWLSFKTAENSITQDEERIFKKIVR